MSKMSKVDAIDRLFTSQIEGLRRETMAALGAAEKATEIAAAEAAERLLAHNGLITQMREQAASFVSRELFDSHVRRIEQRVEAAERFQARIMGGFVLVALLGVGNLVEALAR